MKKFHSLFLSILTVSSVFFLHARPVYACSCVMPRPPLEELNDSTAVFSGKVEKIAAAERGYEVTFQVDQAWKGVEDSSFTVHTGEGGGDCGFSFQEGESYLVYAYSNGGYMDTGICSGTQVLSDASEDLKQLGSGTRTSPESPAPQQNEAALWTALAGVLILVGGYLVLPKRK